MLKLYVTRELSILLLSSATFFLSVACNEIHKPALIKSPGPLQRNITGHYQNYGKYNPHLEYLDNLELTIFENNGKLEGYIKRKFRSNRSANLIFGEYEAKLYDAIHSSDEIIFRQTWLQTCYFPYIGPFDKKITEWQDTDKGEAECFNANRIAESNDEEKKEAMGSHYFKLAGDDEIWWQKGEADSWAKFRRVKRSQTIKNWIP